MNAFLFILLSVCGIILYGNGLPYRDLFNRYQNRDDDYYEIYYLRKIPKLKTSPEKVKQFFINHLSWFPVNELEAEQNGGRSSFHSRRNDETDDILEEHPVQNKTIIKTSNHTLKVKEKIKHKFKNFTENHHLASNWTDIKSKSSKSMHKVADYIKKQHIKDVLKNVTHPLRYRGSHHHNHSKSCECDPNLLGYKYLGPSIRIHPKSSYVKVIKGTTTTKSPTKYPTPNIPELELPDLELLSPKLPKLPTTKLNRKSSTTKLPDLESPITELPTPKLPNPDLPGPEEPTPKLPESELPNPELPGPEEPKPPDQESPNPDLPGPEEPKLPDQEMPNPELPSPQEPQLPDQEMPNPELPSPQEPKLLDQELPNQDLPSQKLPLFEYPMFHTHYSYPRKIKVIIDLNNPEKSSKQERNVNEKSYLATVEADSTNSTNVLETAGEMASDLAGRVTSLWHCVLGSHHIPDIKDVKFYLYTRRNIIQPELLKVNYELINEKTKANSTRVDVKCVDLPPEKIGKFERISDKNREIITSNFLNINAPTKILIHGYTGSYKDSRMAKIKDAYLSSGRYNVIQVDWEMLAAPPCYIRVTHNSKFVGETIAQFINGLYLVGLNMSLIHLVGFSLGAQVAGFVGNNATLAPVCRITGLDPALPLFLHTQPSGHLDRLDAKFVDVIHTCGGILAMLDPLGHVDFYPNGGTRQPGCEFSNLKCSHSRAPQYFAESVISQKKFTGQLCLTWEEFVAGDCNNTTDTSFMGEPCSRRSAAGKYYLLTKSKEPFVL